MLDFSYKVRKNLTRVKTDIYVAAILKGTEQK